MLAVGPPGCGKTVIASQIIQAEPRWRVLFVVHRYELADQAYKTLLAMGVHVGIVMAQDEALHGSKRLDASARVQVASVQTLAHRREAEPLMIDLIVFDEAHRVMAKSYRTIANAHAEARVLGLTATPERTDGQGLGDFFGDMFVIAQPSKLQEAKYLASPRWFGARADIVAKLTDRLRGARVSSGDYCPDDLARAVDSKMLIGEVVSEALRIAPGVSKAVFAGSVRHSRQLAARFRQAGITSAHLDGETPSKERTAMLSALGGGEIEALCNYDVLAEGWDLPHLGAVVLARPFRSRTKYLQVIGRGMRWRQGPRPVVIDHGNNAPRFGLWPGDDLEWSLAGTPRRLGEPLWKQCQGCLERIPLAATVCTTCGFECPIDRVAREREEAEVRLEEATRAEYLAIRGRVVAMAKQKNAPPGWVDKVMARAVD